MMATESIPESPFEREAKMDEQIQRVLEKLTDMEMTYRIAQHPPVDTIEEMEALGLRNMGAVAKNLFLRDDKKRRFFLVMLENHKRADLKELAVLLGSTKLGFASEVSLMQLLGLERGAVSPLGILNDTDCRVEVALDEDLAQLGEIAVHPNRNTATVWMNPSDLIRLIRGHGNALTTICVPQ